MPDTPASDAFPEPTDAEKIKARKDGVVDAIQESTKEAYKTGANEAYDGDSPSQRFNGTFEVAHIQDMVDLPLDVLADKLNPKTDTGPITEAQIAGLLEVERSGKNRTDVVKLFMKRLGIKSPYEVTAAGPAWTNDTTNITKL